MLDNLKIRLTDKLSPFLFNKKRFKIALGGRGGTKSQSCVDILLYLVQQEGLRVCVFREFGSSIEDSVWQLISDEIVRIGIPGFHIGNRKISHSGGGFFKSKGLGRGSKSVKSFSGFDIFLVEEGDFITAEILKDLTPTLRKAGSELWIIFNPQSREDTISKRFLVPFYKDLLRNGVYEDTLHYVAWTNYDENPWFPEELEAERKWDYEHLKRAEYDHKWRGFFNDTVEQAIIEPEWFDAAIDAHLKIGFKPRGIEVVGFDPSDLGADPKGLTHRHGSVILESLQNDHGDANEGMDWALEYALQNRVDLFTWDCDGMGVSLNRQVKQALDGKKIDFQMYKGSQGVDHPNLVYKGIKSSKKKSKTNKETFKNKRAQKSWMLRDRYYNTYLAVTKGIYTDPDKMISVSSKVSDIENLRVETCRIPRKPNPNGLIQLWDKPTMLSKFGIASPNLFDSSVIAFETPAETKKQKRKMRYTGWAA